MDNKVKISMHNKFQIEVVDGNTKEVKQKAQAYNIVCNNLWHYVIETTSAFATHIQYGSGSGTPSATDTSLFSRAGGVGVTSVSLTCDYRNKLITRVSKIVLGLTDAVGVTITEVGMAAGASDGSLSTHAMLQDMNGNPISIEKTNTDIINIYATIYCHWEVDACVTFYPKGNMLWSLTGGANSFGSMPMGVSLGMFEVSSGKTWTKTASLANKKITYVAPRFSQDEGNIGGIVSLQGYGDYDGIAIKQGTVSWNKSKVTNESVGTGDGENTKFKTKFHYPENATVYVNGVAQTSTQVQVLKRRNSNSANMIPLDSGSVDNDLVYAPLSSNAVGVIMYHADYDTFDLMRVNVNSSWSYAVGSLEASNDLVNWTTIASGERVGYITNYFDVPQQYKRYKYFRTNVSGGSGWAGSFTNSFDGYNIVFNNPPADGDVITITYDTECIPKDSDHVLDATVIFEFGNYTPAS